MSNLNARLCANIKPEFQRQIIHLAIASSQGLNYNSEKIERTRVDYNWTEEELDLVIKTYRGIVSMYMQVKEEEFESILLANGFSQDFIDNLPFKLSHQ